MFLVIVSASFSLGMYTSLFLVATLALSVSASTHQVHTAAQLATALSQVKAGDTIQLADGEYHGSFKAHSSGTAKKPILLTGSRKAMLSSTSYGLHLEGCSHWELKGFTIHNSKKGLVLDKSSHNTIDSIEVHNINEEGVHFRKDSSDNVLRNSDIHNTGLKAPGFGEGVYIGSAVSHWENTHKPDRSDRNRIEHNTIGPHVSGESIDVKEGTCCGTIANNHFDGSGMTGVHFADSWIDLKGDKYLVEKNTGTHSIKDGIQVHHQAPAMEGLKSIGLLGGCHNKIFHNTCSDIHGKCVDVTIAHSTVLHSNDCPNEVKN